MILSSIPQPRHVQLFRCFLSPSAPTPSRSKLMKGGKGKSVAGRQSWILPIQILKFCTSGEMDSQVPWSKPPSKLSCNSPHPVTIRTVSPKLPFTELAWRTVGLALYHSADTLLYKRPLHHLLQGETHPTPPGLGRGVLDVLHRSNLINRAPCLCSARLQLNSEGGEWKGAVSFCNSLIRRRLARLPFHSPCLEHRVKAGPDRRWSMTWSGGRRGACPSATPGCGVWGCACLPWPWLWMTL